MEYVYIKYTYGMRIRIVQPWWGLCSWEAPGFSMEEVQKQQAGQWSVAPRDVRRRPQLTIQAQSQSKGYSIDAGYICKLCLIRCN